MNYFKKSLSVVLGILFLANSLYAQNLQRVSPLELGMDPVRLQKVDDVINASINKKEIPGTAVDTQHSRDSNTQKLLLKLKTVSN